MRITEQDIITVISNRFPVNKSILLSKKENPTIRQAKGAFVELCEFFGVKQKLVSRNDNIHTPSERMLKILKALVIKNKADSTGVVKEKVWYDEEDKSFLISGSNRYEILILNTCFGSNVLLMLNYNPISTFDSLYDAKNEVNRYENIYSRTE